jgi:hypothetical protein
MRNTIVGGAVLLATALAGCGAEDQLTSPLSAASAATPVESVTGSAHFFQDAVGGGFVRRILSFHATRQADGTVEGSWQLIGGAAIVNGPITCFTIAGNGVRVGAQVGTAKFTTFIEGSDTGWYIEDDGEGSGSDDQASRLIFNGPSGVADAFCDGTHTESRVEERRDLFGGNVQIHQ